MSQFSRFHELKLWRIKVFKTFTTTIEHLCDKIINDNRIINVMIPSFKSKSYNVMKLTDTSEESISVVKLK